MTPTQTFREWRDEKIVRGHVPHYGLITIRQTGVVSESNMKEPSWARQGVEDREILQQRHAAEDVRRAEAF